MRASCGEAAGCGVPMALCTVLAPFAIWTYPGDGTLCCRVWCGCGEDVTCWLRPEGVREGICRRVCLPGERMLDGEGTVGADWGVGVPAGESDGERSELISMVILTPSFLSLLQGCACAQRTSTFSFYGREVQELRGIESVVTTGMERGQAIGAKGEVVWARAAG